MTTPISSKSSVTWVSPNTRSSSQYITATDTLNSSPFHSQRSRVLSSRGLTMG